MRIFKELSNDDKARFVIALFNPLVWVACILLFAYKFTTAAWVFVGIGDFHFFMTISPLDPERLHRSANFCDKKALGSSNKYEAWKFNKLASICRSRASKGV